MTRKCAGCNKRALGGAPMLHNHVWLQLAAKNEILCWSCLLNRATERRVYLSLESLKPCPVNLFGWPRSWFNLFAEHNSPPTIVDAEWSEAARLGQWLDEQESTEKTSVQLTLPMGRH
jgi:hypothetical protein